MKKWKLVKSENVFKTPWLAIDKNSYQLPNGKTVDDFYNLIRPDYVEIIALDKNDHLILEKQYHRGIDQIIYNLPAGWVEKDENPKATVQRELKEETGYFAKSIKLMGILDAQPCFCSMKAYVFLVKIEDNKKTNQRLDKTEDLQTIKLPLKKAYQMIKTGQITDMSTIAALGLYKIADLHADHRYRESH